MTKNTLSRWQQFYLDDPKLQDVTPSACAHQAVRIFTSSNSRIILDLGCGTGRDSLYLAKSGMQVVGLDAARSGLLLAQQRITATQTRIRIWG